MQRDRLMLMVGVLFFFFFNDTATTEIYTLSLHDALPIYAVFGRQEVFADAAAMGILLLPAAEMRLHRSEEHTSELQSQSNLVCRLLLEKKKLLSPDLMRSTVILTINRRQHRFNPHLVVLH